MDEFTNVISYLGCVNAYGGLIEEMNHEFMSVLESSKTDMTNLKDANDIANKFHDIFVRCVLKSANIKSKISK